MLKSMFGLTRVKPKPTPVIVHDGPLEAPGIGNRLNQLETRMGKLELENAERQLAVVNALEKVMTQLRARERKRKVLEDAASEEISSDPSLQDPPPAERRRDAVGAPSPRLTMNIRGW